MNFRNRKRIVLTVVVLVLAVILAGCNKKPAETQEQKSKKQVQIQIIEQQDQVVTTLSASGTVVPKQYSVIRSLTPGTVEYLASIGSEISIGQPLFQISDANVENAYFNASQNLKQTQSITGQRVEQAQLALSSAQARFDLASSNLVNTQQQVEQNKVTVRNSAVATYDSAYSVIKQALSYLSKGAIANFEFRYREIASNDDQLRSNADSQFQLAAQRFVQLSVRAESTDLAGSLEQLRAALVEAKLAVDQSVVLLQGNSSFASEQLIVAGYQTQINQQTSAVIGALDGLQSVEINSKLSVNQTQNQYNLAKIDLENSQIALTNAKNSAELEVTIAQSGFDAAAYNFSNLSLSSPFSGTILSHFVNIGEQIQPGQQLVEVGNLSIVEISVGVDVDFASGLKKGDKVLIDGSQEGFIADLEPIGNIQSGKVGVTVQSQNQANGLTAGDVAEIQFALTFTQSDLIIIPIKAATIETNGTTVLLIQDGKAVKHSVVLGQVFGNRVSVASGLEVGDQLILSNGVFVAEGDEVEIVQ